MKILIQNVQILTMNHKNESYRHGFVMIENDQIINLGHMQQLPIDMNCEILDGKGAILIPGMVNTHTHCAMIPFRSLKEDIKDRLHRFFFPLEKNITAEFVYHSAKYAMAEMLLAGVTAFADMYYFEEEVAKACDEMEMRAILGETIVNFPVCDSKEAFGGLAYAKKFVENWKNHPLIQPAIAPHAPYTNNEKSLTQAKQVADEYDTPILTHLSEMEMEIEKYKKENNQTPVEYLDELDFLSERLIAAHCIFLTERDIEILAQRKVKIAHCIGANTKSAKGIAPVKKILDASIPVGLGTDGPSSGNTLDIFTQQKLFACFHKVANHDNTVFPSDEIVKLATYGGSQVLGLEKITGTIELGKKADFILVETDSVNMFPVSDPYSVLVYSANASNVRDVFINGKQVVKNKQLTHHSLPSLKRNVEECMENFLIEAEKL